MACVDRYGPAASFLSTFNPSVQTVCLANERRALTGTAPTIATVAVAYGPDVAESWIAIQLQDLAKFAGVKDKMSLPQIDELSKIVAAEYGHLKVSEFALFLAKLKSGRYGRFYGSVDPMAITCSLREFERERRELKRAYDAEAERLERERQFEVSKRLSWAYAQQCAALGLTQSEYAELAWLFNMGYESKHLSAL